MSSAGRDKVLGFTGGQWVELTDDTREWLGKPGTLVRLVKVEGDVLTIDPGTAIPAGAIKKTDFPLNPKVRRWDSDGHIDVKVSATNQGWIQSVLDSVSGLSEGLVKTIQRLFSGAGLSIIGSIFSLIILISGYFFFEMQKRTKSVMSK